MTLPHTEIYKYVDEADTYFTIITEIKLKRVHLVNFECPCIA